MTISLQCNEALCYNYADYGIKEKYESNGSITCTHTNIRIHCIHILKINIKQNLKNNHHTVLGRVSKTNKIKILYLDKFIWKNTGVISNHLMALEFFLILVRWNLIFAK